MDIGVVHGVSHTLLYNLVDQFLDDFALIEAYKLDYPLHDPAQMEEIEEGFAALSGGVVRGCVGALDGMVVRIIKPSKKDTDNVQDFRNRKGCYAFVLQGICDAKRRFIYGSVKCYGNTHDSQAFKMSELAAKLESGALPPGYYIVGDEAYAASNWLLTPFPGRRLDVMKDSFNFYQSKMRINIEWFVVFPALGLHAHMSTCL